MLEMLTNVVQKVTYFTGKNRLQSINLSTLFPVKYGDIHNFKNKRLRGIREFRCGNFFR